ncbi:MAG: hypothetical protein OHK0038_15850 [Flammeovirgaceae bacterium]
MPVRIVKDTPDNGVLNDVLNNSGGGSSRGGGFDISTITNILGTLGNLSGGQGGSGGMGALGGLVNSFINQQSGGGSSTSGLGSLFNNLIGQQGGGLGSLFNVIGQVTGNQGNNSRMVDLGGLINTFLSGSGNRSVSNNQNQGGGANPLLAAFASMAINACIRYASNKFMNNNSGGRSGFAMNTAAPNTNSAEQVLQHRLESAKVCVSLWNYACGSDRQFQNEEKQAIQTLINEQVKFLFPDSIAEQSEVLEELQNTFSNPVPAEKIVQAAQSDPQFAGDLYGQACMLIAVDKSLQQSERSFLDKLAVDFGLPPQTAQTIRSQFGL